MVRQTRLFRTASQCAGLLLVLAGCGGGDGAAPGGRGTVEVRFAWPQDAEGRLIPSAANSVRVALRQNGAEVRTTVLTRPLSGEPNEARTAINDLPPGVYALTATAHPEAAGGGTAQATGTLAGLTVVAGQVTPARLTLGSTVARFLIDPEEVSLQAGGGRRALTVQAFDADNQLVLLRPDLFFWSVADNAGVVVPTNGLVAVVGEGGTAAGPAPSGPTADVLALGQAGVTTVLVSVLQQAGVEASRLSASARVSVTAPLALDPRPAPPDTNFLVAELMQAVREPAEGTVSLFVNLLLFSTNPADPPRPHTDANAANFALTLNGQTVTPLSVGPADSTTDPLNLFVVLDLSTGAPLAQTQEAARLMVDGMEGNDRFTIVASGVANRIVVGPTGKQAALREAIDGLAIEPGEGSFFGALGLAINAAGGEDRAGIIGLTLTGSDDRRAVVDSLLVPGGPPISSVVRAGDAQPFGVKDDLIKLAQDTGGTSLIAGSANQLVEHAGRVYRGIKQAIQIRLPQPPPDVVLGGSFSFPSADGSENFDGSLNGRF